MKSCLKTVKGLFLNYISYNYLHYNISSKNEINYSSFFSYLSVLR